MSSEPSTSFSDLTSALNCLKAPKPSYEPWCTEICSERPKEFRHDFHAIDWLHEGIKEYLNKPDLKMIQRAWRNFSGWFCLILIGMVSALVAVQITIGEEYFYGIKFGYCSKNFYLNEEQCCWASNSSEHDCPEWSRWAEILEIPKDYVYYFDYAWYVISSSLLATVAAMLVKHFAPYASGSGIPEIKMILSGYLVHGYLSVKTLVIKALTLSMSVASGLTLGKEGPMIHVASCVGANIIPFFDKFRENEAKKREVLSASAASGLSVAFTSPIAGILFSLEEVSYYFPHKALMRAFVCSMAGAGTLLSINAFGESHRHIFQMEYSRPFSFIELPVVFAVGYIGACCGTIFAKGIKWWNIGRKISGLGDHPVLEVFIVTFFTSVVLFPNKYGRMSMAKVISNMLTSCGVGSESDLCRYTRNFEGPNPPNVPLGPADPSVYAEMMHVMEAAILRLSLTAFTFGMKIPAGAFVPSLCIGSMFGRTIGFFVEQVAYYYKDNYPFRNLCTKAEDCYTPEFYAMMGAVAMLGGVTRMTVTLVVMMFEITGSVYYIIPTMLTVMTSKYCSEFLSPQGYYDSYLEVKDFPFIDYKIEYKGKALAGEVARIKTKRMVFLHTESMTIRDVEEYLQRYPFWGFPVVISPDQPSVVGYVTRIDLQIAINEYQKQHGFEGIKETVVIFSDSQVEAEEPILDLRDIVHASYISVTEVTPFKVVLDIFTKMGVKQILVVEKGLLVGIITKKDAYNQLKNEPKSH